MPGVSAGTMLLAAGIYPLLIGAVAEISSLRARFSTLAPLAVVLATALLVVFGAAGAVRTAIEAAPTQLFSLFIGLTLGGAPLLLRMAHPARPVFALFAIAGFLAAAAPSAISLAAVQLPAAGSGSEAGAAAAATMFAGGAVAAFAMVLPGISGSYVLLLLGLYIPLLDGLSRVGAAFAGGPLRFDAAASAVLGIAPFFVGMALGVAVAARIVRYFLNRKRQATLGALFGLLLGATVGLWPFQNADGARVAPGASEIPLAAALIAAGFMLAALLGRGKRESATPAAFGSREPTGKRAPASSSEEPPTP